MITITKQVHFTRGGAGRRKMSTTPPKPKVERKPRIPHIAKLMALAIRYDKLLRDGTVADTVELAELCRVSQPRITQILNLNHLAPEHPGRPAPPADRNHRPRPHPRSIAAPSRGRDLLRQTAGNMVKAAVGKWRLRAVIKLIWEFLPQVVTY